MPPRKNESAAVIAVLDTLIAEAAVRHLRRHALLTTGQLIRLLLRDDSVLTARSDPGRRKQIERALRGERARKLRIEEVRGEFTPAGHLGRRPRSAWRIAPRRLGLVVGVVGHRLRIGSSDTQKHEKGRNSA